jgi:endonuclease/exonuclease/phosphatase family metal-dependent hydrolase
VHSFLCGVSAALSLFFFALGCSAPRAANNAARADAVPPLRLRVLTYNIHHGEGVDGRFDLERTARVITEQQPDLVAVQEVDVKTRRSGGVDQAAELARLTGMHTAFGKARDYQGGDYGQALLSRFPVENFRVHALPGDPASERRIALSATVRPWGRGPAVRFVGTHLHHLPDEANRLQQAAELNRLFAGAEDDTATILAGDLNAEPASETMGMLLARWWDAAARAEGISPEEMGARQLTYPSNEPRKRIDYVLVRPTGGAWRVLSTRVITETVASDHSPVLAVVEWVGMK